MKKILIAIIFCVIFYSFRTSAQSRESFNSLIILNDTVLSYQFTIRNDGDTCEIILREPRRNLLIARDTFPSVNLNGSYFIYSLQDALRRSVYRNHFTEDLNFIIKVNTLFNETNTFYNGIKNKLRDQKSSKFKFDKNYIINNTAFKIHFDTLNQRNNLSIKLVKWNGQLFSDSFPAFTKEAVQANFKSLFANFSEVKNGTKISCKTKQGIKKIASNYYQIVSSNLVSKDTLLKGRKADSANYRLIIGTNFDFLDGAKVNNLYYNLDVFLPSISDYGKLGFHAGIYQLRDISIDSSSSISPIHNTIKEFPSFQNPDDTLFLSVRTVKTKTTRQTDQLGLFLSPLLRLSSNPDFNTDEKRQLVLYGCLHLEAIRRNFTFKSQATAISTTDSVPVTVNNLASYRVIPDELTTKYTQYEGYFGAGLVFYHSNKFVNLKMKFLSGFANTDKAHAFYDVSFDIYEKGVGITLGGEIRGLFLSTSSHSYVSPFYNVYLAKSFSLKKLGEFIKGV